MQWYYAIDGQRLGPVSQTEFERLVHAGTITPGTLVWRKPMHAWQSLADVLATDPTAVAPKEPDLPPPLASEAFDTASTSSSTTISPSRATTRGASPSSAPGVKIFSAGTVAYGGFWRRVAARLIDTFILWFAGQIVIGVLGRAFFPGQMKTLESIQQQAHLATPEQIMAVSGLLCLACGVSLLLGLVYDCFFLKKYAATPGKLALGLAICRSDGSPLSLGRIIGRYFALMLNGLTLGLSYLAVAFDEQKRGIHDCLCDTRVVRTRR